MLTDCVCCGNQTERRLYNDFYEQWESVCYDYLCEKRWYNETQVTINSEDL